MLCMDCEPPVEPELPNADVSMVANLVTTCQPCPAPAAFPPLSSCIPQGTPYRRRPANQSLPKQALTYVAGYVAAKCSAFDKTLGQVTSDLRGECIAPSAVRTAKEQGSMRSAKLFYLVLPEVQWRPDSWGSCKPCYWLVERKVSDEPNSRELPSLKDHVSVMAVGSWRWWVVAVTVSLAHEMLFCKLPLA